MKRNLIIASVVIAAGLFAAGAVYWKSANGAKNTHEATAVAGQKPQSLSVPSISSSATWAISANQAKPAAIPGILGTLPPDDDGVLAARRIDALNGNLSLKDQSELAAWITSAKPERYSGIMWLSVQNEAMNNLGAQHQPCTEWANSLMALAGDKGREPGLRDYAVQHLGEWIEPVNGREPCETDARRRNAMVAVMLNAAQDANDDVAGTALLVLSDLLNVSERAERLGQPLSRYPLSLKADQLRPVAVELASAANAGEAARMTALQVCAAQGFGEALPSARLIAADARQPFALRLTAIAALGRLGDPGDETILKNIVAEGNKQILRAAEPALKRLQAREGALNSPEQSQS